MAPTRKGVWRQKWDFVSKAGLWFLTWPDDRTSTRVISGHVSYFFTKRCGPFVDAAAYVGLRARTAQLRRNRPHIFLTLVFPRFSSGISEECPGWMSPSESEGRYYTYLFECWQEAGRIRRNRIVDSILSFWSIDSILGNAGWHGGDGCATCTINFLDLSFKQRLGYNSQLAPERATRKGGIWAKMRVLEVVVIESNPIWMIWSLFCMIYIFINLDKRSRRYRSRSTCTHKPW